jgi:replicative DNA helicase
MSDEKKYPSQEAEMAYLGSLILMGGTPSELIEAIDACHAEWFWSVKHTVIFEAISACYVINNSVDLVLLKDRLVYNKNLDIAGGVGYVASLAETVPTASNWKHYLETIRVTAKRRSIGSLGARLADLSKRDGPEARIEQRDVFNQLEAVIADDGEKGRLVEMSELMRGWELPTLKEHPPHRMLGFPELDRVFGIYNPGRLTIVAGRPGEGKSTLFRQIMLRVSEIEPVSLFSLEESPETFRDKCVCTLSRVSYTDYANGRLDSSQVTRVMIAAGALNEKKIRVFNKEDIGIAKVRVIARWHKATFGCHGAIFIDHLQLMQRPKAKNDNSALSEVSRGLKKIALETSVPLIVASQLNRQVEHRESRRPSLSDLRDSGAIEADADNVLFIFSPDVEAREQKLISIGKHRDGAIAESNAVLLPFGALEPQGMLTPPIELLESARDARYGQ